MKKYTRRHYNKKLLALGLSAFMGIGLVSTGFAAWVMSKDADENVSAGINVSTITDSSANIVLDSAIYTLSGDTKKLVNNFSFDAPTDDRVGRLYSDGTGGENLVVTISGRLYATEAYELSAELVGLPDGVKDAIQAGYLAWANEDYAFTTEKINQDQTIQIEQPVEITLGTTKTDDSDGGEYSGKEYREFSFNIEFVWGSKFGGVNPSIYYDNAGSDISDAEMQNEMETFWYCLTGSDKTEDEDGKLPHEKESQALSFTVVLKAEISQDGE